MATERTFGIVKPDAVAKGAVGAVIDMVEKGGLRGWARGLLGQTAAPLPAPPPPRTSGEGDRSFFLPRRPRRGRVREGDYGLTEYPQYRYTPAHQWISGP